jgi:signal transduction histidine kinase/nitroreductase
VAGEAKPLSDEARRFVVGAGDAERFRPDPVPREILDGIIEAATARRPTRFATPPWRVMVVVGEERERLVSRVAEALARHWGLGTAGPRGLASEAVLNAPALVLVFSTVPASESVEAFGLVAGAVQSMILLGHYLGLASHRIFSAHVVPEAALDYAAEFLGPEVRGGELVTLLAVGWPAEEVPPPSGPGAHATWVGEGETVAPEIATTADLRPPAPLLRSPHRERVFVVDAYPYNRALLEAQLTRANYVVEVFTDGQSLYRRDMASGAPPHLLVVGDTLPDTSGLELVRRLRRAGEPAPVIMTTVRRDSAFRIAGLTAGADYYLRKPVNAVELYTAARILLDRHRLVEDLKSANSELERLIEEVRTAQARLVQQAKMAALGQLVAGVAHEINTPLAAVVSNNDLFLRCFQRLREALKVAPVSLEDRSVVERDLSAVEELTAITREACVRMTGIVRTLRTFARLDEADVKAVDLHEGLESTLVLVAHLLKGGIAVERHYGELPRVECHPNQINQVFMNLIVNACQAMGEKGTLTLSSRAVGNEVEVSVGDTGHGIPTERLASIFDPGFTTKGPTIGTGLGLSIVYQIVSGHGGEILVESEVDHGSVFTVRLPVHHQRAAEATS